MPRGVLPDLPPAFPGGQVARGGRVGLLGNKDYMQTPFSVTTYTEQTIRDQQATSVAEVLTTSDPSVRAAIGCGNRYDALTIRGFRIENREFALNGLYGLVPDFRTNPAPIERIELLKGPAAFLYGVSPNGSVGGTVNLVTKHAGAEPLTRVTADLATTARGGAQVDVARRYGEERQVGVRVNGSIFGGNAPIDGLSQRNGVGSLALDYIGDKLRLYADVIYQNDFYDRPTRGYLPLSGFRIPKAPDPRINLSQRFDYSNADSLMGLARAEYDIVPNVTLFGAIGGNRFRYDKQESPGATIVDGAGNASSFSRYQTGGTVAVSGETGVRARFDTFGMSHEAVFTATSLDQDLSLGQITYPNYRTNIYNPVLLSLEGIPLRASSFASGPSSFVRLTSFAGADTMTFADGLFQLIVGARHQEIETGNYAPTTGGLARWYDSAAVTPSIGLVVRPTQVLSFYGNYIEGLTALSAPDNAINTNQVFAPVRSRQYEIGAKVDFKTFGVTLAAFQITLPTGITDAATRTFGIAGEQRNRGFEGTVFGEVAPGLRLLGGATLIDGRLTRTAGGANDGNAAVGVPRFQANVGLEWDTPSLPGLTALARVVYTSSAYTSITNTQKVPDWATVDLGLRYTTVAGTTPVTVRALVTNVTDARYWIANPTGYLISGPPRTLWLSASADF